MKRTIKVVIPTHPWEETTDVKLWYKLKWNKGTEIQTAFVYNDTRILNLEIPPGQTVYICAYPLGSMLPFGTGISAHNSKTVFVLNQNEGFLADILMNSEDSSVLTLNFEKLVQKAETETPDFRNLNTSLLLQSVLNGKITAKSFEQTEMQTFSDIAMYSGLWIPESIFEDPFTVNEDGNSPVMTLSMGIHRYLCLKRNLEIRLVVSEEGIFRYEKTAEVGI